MPARVGDARRRRASAWVLATLSGLGVLAVIALVAGLLLAQQGRNTATVSVPNVVGFTQAAAASELSKAGLTMNLGPNEQNATCKVGMVTSQMPQATTSVARQSPVTVHLCGGAPNIQIPIDLVGNTFDYVKGKLEGLGLKVTRQDVNNAANKDQVLKVNPPSGSSVAAGSTVVVDVSKGNIKQVPDVRGLSEQDATNQLSAAGFNVNVTYRDSAPQNADKVVDQNPQGNTQQAAGSVVTITVTRARPQPTPSSTTPSPTPTSPSPSPGGIFGGGGGGSGTPIP
jgi:serine/threonine-protein kinase